MATKVTYPMMAGTHFVVQAQDDRGTWHDIFTCNDYDDGLAAECLCRALLNFSGVKAAQVMAVTQTPRIGFGDLWGFPGKRIDGEGA
jgi:hypothetical protein